MSQNLSKLLKATFSEEQIIKTETEQKTNDNIIQDMDESAKSKDFF